MRISVLLLLLLSVLVCADGQVRCDLISGFRLECDVSSGIDLSRRTRKEGAEERIIYDIIMSKDAILDQWAPFNLTFTPSQDGVVNISLRAAHAQGFPWIHIDDVRCEGAELQNADFELRNKNGAATGWGGSKDNLVEDAAKAKSGQSFARVNYQHHLAQNIRVSKDQKVHLSFVYRPETVTVLEVPDGMNKVMDKAMATVVTISTQRFECRPTYENCSVYLTKPQAQREQQQTVRLTYRQAGKQDWQEAFPMVYVPQEGAWRGSIFFLEENCDYEARVEIQGTENEVLTQSFRTRNSQVPIARTIELSPENFSGELVISESGTAEGYIRYTMRPGAVLLGQRELNGAVIRVDNAKYLVFDGLVIKGNMAKHCLYLDNAEEIIVRNCEFSDFGRSDYVRDYRLGGSWTYKGNVVGWEGGIFLRTVLNVLLERNYVHSPSSASHSWFYSHPNGPEAVFLDRCRGGVVLRYNDLVGSDKRRWNDTIEGSGNGSIDGGIGRDADVYGNLFAFANDDSIEIEGMEMNVRLYLNRFEGSLCGVSTGCCRLGPSYQFRNLYYRLGDENARFSAPFKNGMGNQGYGSIFILSNTVFSPGLRSGFSGFHAQPPQGEMALTNPKAYTRNNILSCQDEFFGRDWFVWNTDIDADLLDLGDAGKMPARKEKLLAAGKQLRGIWAAPQYLDAANGFFALRPDSPGYNAAVALPNLSTRHVGAFQDDGIEFLPYRPIPVRSDRYEVFFADEKATLQQQFKITVSGSAHESAFRVHTNDDFFSVSPESGVFRSGETQVFTVTLHPEKMEKPQMFRGMILLRQSDGYSCPVSVYADYRNCPARLAEAQKHALHFPGSGRSGEVISTEVEIPEEGCYFMFVKGQMEGWGKVTITIGDYFKTADSARLINRYEPGLLNRYGIVRNGHLSGYYMFLKPGKHPVTFQTALNEAEIEGFMLTREPEWFLR